MNPNCKSHLVTKRYIGPETWTDDLEGHVEGKEHVTCMRYKTYTDFRWGSLMEKWNIENLGAYRSIILIKRILQK
jgi:hypothetical protein